MMAWPCWLIRRVFPAAGVPLHARRCSSAPMGHTSPAGDGGGRPCPLGAPPQAGVRPRCGGSAVPLGWARAGALSGGGAPDAPGHQGCWPRRNPLPRAGRGTGEVAGTAPAAPGASSAGCQQHHTSRQRAAHRRAAGSCAMSALTRDSQGGGAAGDPPGTAPPSWWHQPLGPRRQPSATPGLPVTPCFSNETKGGLGFFFFSSSSRIPRGSQI